VIANVHSALGVMPCPTAVGDRAPASATALTALP